MEAPRADKKPYSITVHGHTRVDPYYWLRERDNPEVIKYLQAENAYTEAVLAPYSSLRETLYREIVSRIKKDDVTVPYRLRGYWYYIRYEGEKEYPVYCRRKDEEGAPEEVLLDVNLLAAGKPYCQIASLNVSPDNRWLAYGVDFTGRRLYTLYFKNLQTGELLETTIPGTAGNVAWANDNRTVFYSLKEEETLRSSRIMRYVLGTPLTEAREVYCEEDETFDVHVYRSKSEKYIFIVSSANSSSEVRWIETCCPEGEFHVVQPREKDHEYGVMHYGDEFFILTNWKAKNFRLMKTSVSRPSREYWQEIIPHREKVLLEDVEIFTDYLAVEERCEGLVQIRVIHRASGEEKYIDFGEEVYVASLSVNTEFDTPWLRYSYSSLTTPPSVIEYNMHTGEKVIKKQQEVPGGFSSENYFAERCWVPARDGEKIPVSLVYHRSFRKDGQAPLLLYGYGAYGISTEPVFSAARLSLLDRGFVFAIAHVRGGEELGRQWYEEGKLLNKKNTFYDFIDCAEFLIREKYTSPHCLFIKGGSAGGLLVGAVINMRPELFKGAIAAVPFVDVVTTMLDDSIPLTTGEYDEWGNPHDKTYYEYMLSYSPYDNVERKEYPALLVIAGLHDSQVQYWEPAKWVARLREMKTDTHPLLLYTHMEAGHSGLSGRFRSHMETSLEYTFLLMLAGRTE